VAGAILLAFGIAAAIGLFLAVVGWRHPPPNLYECRRCGHAFLRRGAAGYPRKCPACGSEAWSAT
jgi:rubrerythrin